MSLVRKIGERGQVTIPKDIREAENLEGGDEVEFKNDNGKIRIEKKEDLEPRLREGYKSMNSDISEEMLNASKEARERIK